MLKILHVLTDTNIGGAGTYVATYVKNHNSSLFDVSVLIPENSQVKKLLSDADCNIIETNIAPDKSLDFKSIGLIRKVIKDGKFDLVHAHGSASARIAAKGICKCVFTKHTLSTGSGMVSKLVYGALGGTAIAVSEASANNLVELGFDTKNIYTVYNGADDMSVPTPAQKNDAKKSFGIDENKFVIGCVARFHPVKDHKTLLMAAKLVLEKNDDIVFLFVGDGELKTEMMQLAKEYGISDKCVFTGIVYDRHRAYHAMDVYTITSLHETFGLSMVESWSASLPSVITDANGLSEIAVKNETSIICDVGDYEDLASAYLTLFEEPQKREAFAKKSLERYKNKFSAKVFAENLEKIYSNIV